MLPLVELKTRRVAMLLAGLSSEALGHWRGGSYRTKWDPDGELLRILLQARRGTSGDYVVLEKEEQGGLVDAGNVLWEQMYVNG